jgi:hypothetical protein
MDKNTQDLLETVNFIKDYMIANMATKDDLVELRQEMYEGFAAQSERIGNLEKTTREILDELRPLSRAQSADAVTIVRHEQRITRIEKHLDLVTK